MEQTDSYKRKEGEVGTDLKKVNGLVKGHISRTHGQKQQCGD